jgi:futalosine hydrolase
MEILIVAATSLELNFFLKKRISCDILITGVGSVATVYHLQNKIRQKKYDLIIQAGIAGSFDPKTGLGKIALVKKDCFGDLGMEEKGNFRTLFDNGFIRKNQFPFSNGWLINRNKILKSISLPTVSSVSINKVSDSKKIRKQLIDKFNPDIESMEGAAFHYVCLQEKIPFLQIRSISNFVGERDKSKWNMKEAIENLNKELFNLLTELRKQP